MQGNLCMNCKNYIGLNQCKAFKEIPNGIWFNKIDHTKPYKGDNGIQFKQIKTTA